jgi:hypothetical protein
MADRWPYPGDSPVVVARRVALAYRARLAESDPDACAALDKRLTLWGQGWAVSKLVTFSLDDWLNPRQAAEVASIEVHSIAQLRRSGRLPGRWRNGTWEYRYRDVLALSTVKRHRKRRKREGEADD